MPPDHQNGDHQVDALDDLLAEYFRWIDLGGRADADSFLSSRERPLDDPRLAASLRDYLRDADAVQRLAADTTSLWLEADGPETRSRQRTPAAEQLPTLLGDYELVEEIARGGMGIVYKARQRRLNRTVCVKRILVGEFATEREIERFLGEAEAAASLHHPNIVTIYEVGLDKGEYYFSMEYVPGPSLADRVADGPLPTRRAAEYLRTIARAVHYAHQNHVLHRDLKPSNVVLDERDQPRVTDFGLAKRVGAGSLTATGALVGSPSYMAPEQTRGDREPLDVTSDVYGLGAILYELLTGRPPFRGATPLDTLWQVREREPVRPSLLNPKVPRDLETICLKCLEKLPQRRYPTALAVAEELDRFLSGASIHARPAGPVRKTARWIRRNPIAATIGLALVGVSVVASWAYSTTASSLSQVRVSHAQQARLARQLEGARDEAQDHLYLATIHMARQALADGDLDRLDTLLARAVPADGERDRRGWEWYFLNAVAHQEVQSLRGHEGPVTSVTWAPDGSRLASIGADRTLRIWDGTPDRTLHRFEGPQDAAAGLAWSPSADRIAAAGTDGAIHIWDAGTGQLLFQLAENRAPLRSVAWDPDGLRVAAGGDDGTVLVWDSETGQSLLKLPLHDQRVNSVSWSPEGAHLASAGDDGRVHVVNAADGRTLLTLAAHRDWANAVAWSSDGLRLASVSNGGELKVWRLSAPGNAGPLDAEELVVRFTGNRSSLSAVDFSPDGARLVTAGADPWLTIRSVATGDVVGRLRGHRGSARSVAWDRRSGRIASAGDDGSVKIWDPAGQPEGSPLSRLAAPVRTVAWSPDGRWFAHRDVEDVVTLRRFAAGEPPSARAELTESAQAFAWHPNSTAIALGRGELVTLVELADRQERRYLQGHEGPIWTVCFSPSGERLATGSNDGTVIIWNTASGEQVHTVRGHHGDVRTLTWSGDGRSFATADAQANVRIFSAESGRIRRSFSVAAASVNSLRYSPGDRYLAATTHEGTIQLWEAHTGKKVRTLAGHRGPTWAVLWSPDGRRMASSGQDGMIRLWDPSSGEEVLQLEGHAAAVWSIDWSADGRRLLSASADQTVRLWDTSRGFDRAGSIQPMGRQ